MIYVMNGTRDYHVESRISNESYKIELAVRELVEIGMGEQEIRALLGEILDSEIEAALS